ncbi:hypothetical protein FHS14_001775 [Paenibacillus baekrokdamisoli]|nr:hypothetical protein [Paenibacillus baekrokdamisoli]
MAAEIGNYMHLPEAFGTTLTFLALVALDEISQPAFTTF